MPILRMSELDLSGKRVLIREDLNVPVKDGKVTSEQRILAALPTLRLALDKGAAVMVTSHLGRPKEGSWSAEDSLAPVAARLSQLLGRDVPLLRDWIDGVEVAPRPAGAAGKLPHERRRGQGRRGAVAQVRRPVRRVRDGCLRHRASRAGLDPRRDPLRRRSPAAARC
jgi:hypothetical protein